MLNALEGLGVDLVDVLGAAWPGGKPRELGRDLEPPNGSSVAGGFAELGRDRVACKLGRRDIVAAEGGETRLLRLRRCCVDALVSRVPELSHELCVALRWRLAGYRQNLARQQSQDDAVFICCPHGSVDAQKTCPGTFLSAERHRAVDQPRHEPFEADRYFPQGSTEGCRDPVDHRA